MKHQFVCCFVLFVAAALVLYCLLRDIWVALRPCKAQQPREQCYPFLTMNAVFSCVQTMVWLPMFRIFNTFSPQTLMHAIAQGGCTDTVRESALEIDCGRKILCRTGDPNPRQSLLRLAFQSDALPTELCLTPFNNVSVFLKIESSRAV